MTNSASIPPMADAQDDTRGMNAARAVLAARADECVMCGLCLPHCPTFRLSGLETRSPRGRIALAKALAADGTAEASVADALEACLQCRACEAACPAQVRYGEIIEGARALLRGPGGATLAERAASHPAATGATLSWLGRVARTWPALTHRLGRRARWLLRASKPLLPTAPGHTATALFTGCLSRSFEAGAQQAMLAVGAGIGIDLAVLRNAGCCGAISRHLGDPAGAARMADRNHAAWRQAQVREVVALDSGCIESLRRGAGDVRIAEACRWLLARRDSWAPRLRTLPARIGLYTPCTHRHVLRDAAAARELLAVLPGVEVVPIDAGYGCCGAAGPHLLAHPQQADALALPIVEQIAALRLDALSTTNVGCSLHLGERLALRGVNLSFQHPVACLAQRLLPASLP